jgi:hypothetical protein
LFVWSFVLDVIAIAKMSDGEKDFEILALRQQLRIAERKQARGPSIPHWQKVPVVAVACRFSFSVSCHVE